MHMQANEPVKRSCSSIAHRQGLNRLLRAPARTVVRCSQQQAASSSGVSLDMSVWSDYQSRKLIRSSMHPTEDLVIWNYSDRVNNRGPWDDITTRARALVTDKNGNIVAHSFRKFHDPEKNRHTPTDAFEVFEKLDGSLGILFWYNGGWMFCTRASFRNVIIDKAKEMLDHKYDTSQLDKNLAYSFEVIFPGNRVVLDYKDRSELVFLAAFSKDGTEMYTEGKLLAEQAGFPLVKSHPCDDYKDLKKLDWDNAEGFVVRFANGDRAKIKFSTYLCLHRATGLDALRVWELFLLAVRTGKTFEECMAHIPTEVWDWARVRWDNLQEQHSQLTAEMTEAYQAITSAAGTARADFGQLAGPHKLSNALFFLLDGDEMGARVWLAKTLRPNTAEAMKDKPPPRARAADSASAGASDATGDITASS